MYKKFFFALAICALVCAAIGSRYVQAASANPSVPAGGYVPGCNGWHGYGTTSQGWWIALNSCDTQKLVYGGGGVGGVITTLGAPPVVNAIVAAVVAAAVYRIGTTDKGRGVRIFQYWWVVRMGFPYVTWMWAIEAQ
jgi:hypothetical protein